MSNYEVIPAPWHLKGSGYILFYRFNKSDIQKLNFLTQTFKDNYKGGFACIMLVDYAESNAGPYRELLFIPGKFIYKGMKKYTISKIYVSTQTSVVNGRNNWAIPKERADFTFKSYEKGLEEITVKKDEKNILKIKLKSGGLSFPVNTAFMPFPLLQMKDDKAYLTKFNGKGWGKLASIIDIEIDPLLFPDIAWKKPLAIIKIRDFNICFPIPEIIDLEESIL